MPQSIPASQIVTVTPGVLPAGGNALDLNGVILTTNTRVPIGQVYQFPTYAAVSAFFGANAAETAYAAIYFLGFTNSNKKPGGLLFAQYNTTVVSAYLRGASLSAMTLTQLQAVTGNLSVTIDGTVKTMASTASLSGATSFSNAATLLSTGLTAAVTYDAVSGAFVITSGTTGATSTIGFVSGTAASALGLTAANGAVTSQGSAVATPTAAMNAILAQTTNWASFATTFEPVQADELAFAAWTNAQGTRFTYVDWDTDVTATQANVTTSTGWLIKYQYNYSGTVMVYQDPNVAMFLMGAIASLDFTERNGRATMAFKGQTGLAPSVVDATIAANLIANGYSFYGAYATANQRFLFLNNGQVSGPFLWIDSYVNAIWMANQFQLALMVLLTSAKSIPYNADGYGQISAACLDVILQALTFGAIRAGVTLSQSQADAVNAAAGFKVDRVISTRGWYLLVGDASPQVRAARGSPPCKFFYADGQSVQQINLPTVQIQ